MMKEDACATQFICGNSEFNVAALNGFVKEVKFDKCGSSYVVVAIMGPQGSGKSTLLNHLLGTDFQEMKIECGQSQTTKGIWIAKGVGIEPCTIALDLEGNDSSERIEDDGTFEKQIALFALAVSDVLLINMWYNDTVRKQASGRPLLKTIFQVRMRLFNNPPKKTMLIFVVRDMPSKARFEPLENRLRENIEKMWDEVSKPQAHAMSPLTVFFNVQVVALSNYLEKEETFEEEVAQLRQRIVNSISPGGLVGDRKGVVPASEFSFRTQKMWEEIKLNKDLDLPAHKSARDVYTATLPHLCSKALDSFKLALKESLNQGGGVQLFDSSVRTCTQLAMIEFDQGCAEASVQLTYGDISSIREKLLADMDEHASSVSGEKWSELSAHCKKQVYESLTKEIGPCVTNGGNDVWASIRDLATRRCEEEISKLTTAMLDLGFALDKNKISRIETDIRESTRYAVVKTVRDEADKVLIRMNKRFSIDFNCDSKRNPRRWTRDKQIRSVTKDAQSAALTLLSDMAVIRLDNKPNNVKEVLFSCLLDQVGNSTNDLASSTWEGVSSEDTIITPAECKDSWEKFLEDTVHLIRDATSDVEAHNRHKKEMTIAAIRTAVAVASLGVAVIGLPPLFLALPH